MKISINPERATWEALCMRPQFELEYLESTVKNILSRVRRSGDGALQDLTLQFDKVLVEDFRVRVKEMDEASRTVPSDLKRAMEIAASNIRRFHEIDRQDPPKMETTTGVVCWKKRVPIDKVGIYIPAGTAPLFSTVLMLGIPAQLAGCRQVVLCSPPDAAGKISASVLYAAQLTGISQVYKVGGAQAIAAMAYGTASIPKVYKIFGPGNQYVTLAKQLVTQEGTAVDMPAGPSELLVVADDSADKSFVAADLISQAEHGKDSQVMLVATSQQSLLEISEEVEKQLSTLPRKDIATAALGNSRAILFDNPGDTIDFVNLYAPEHLIINTRDADALTERIVNAGSVFVGNYSPEAAGDYASGTNHTLPTNGYARAFGGVSVESFMKQMTFQRVSAEGIRNLGPVVERMAEAEGLEGHKRAIQVRYKGLPL